MRRTHFTRKAILSSSILAVLVAALPAAPAVFQWDPALNGSGSGGDGTWDLSTANWFSGTDQIWPNDGSTAVFGGIGGNVTLAVPLKAGALQFDATGYTIAGSSSLTLSTVGGAASGFTFPAITVGPANIATISAALAGTEGFHKLGTGTLVLSGANTFTSGLTIDAGTVQLAGTGTLNNNAVNLTATGADLQLNGVSTTVGGLTGIAGTIVENANATLATLTIAGSGTFAGVIQNGLGATGLNLAVISGNQVLSGTNTFAGTVAISGGGQLTVSADANLGNATNTISLAGGILSSSTTFTSARSVTLAAPGGTLDVGGAANLTLSTGLGSDATVLTKTGTGTLTLGAASLRTGTTSVNAGKLAITDVNALGGGDITVAGGATLNSAVNVANANFPANVFLSNGAIFSHTAPQQLIGIAGKSFVIGAGGGTIDTSGGTGTTGKLLLTTGNITGSGILTKTGAADLQLSGANTGYTGTQVNINGLVEVQHVDAFGLGNAALVLGSGGEFVASGINPRQNFTLNTGSTISVNGALNTVSFTGGINVAGTSTAALRYFQTPTTADGFTLTGPLTGAGTLNVTAPAAATLTLSGDRSAFTGSVIAGTNAVVLVNTVTKGGTVGVNGGTVRQNIVNRTSPILGTAGLNATYFNFGSNPGTAANNFATDQLYYAPRSFSRTDVDINIPNGSLGTIPINPVPGFATNILAGGINDGVMWKGILNITNAGSYQFAGTNDDNLVVYIDGVQVGTLGVLSAITNIGTAQTLSAGAHSIVVKQTQGGGGGYATLRYSGPDSGNVSTLIPSTAYTNGSLAPTDLGNISSTGGTVDFATPVSTSLLSLGNGTLTLTSATIDNLTAAAAVITGATPTLAPTTGGLIITGGISQASAGLGLTFAGPYFAEFQGTGTYSGLTTVTGGQLRLNATAGNPLGTGGLTINAPNALGAIANVRLLQSNQLSDTGVLTVTQGILDIGAQSDTIGGLVLGAATTPGLIYGSGGTLTVNGATTLTNGFISANLAGAIGTVTKSSTALVTLAGTGSYTGVINVTGGVLRGIAATALGAGGVGNETTVSTGATLQLSNSLNPAEAVTISGTGVAELVANGALRNLGGTSSIGSLTTGAAATVNVESGELIITGALNQAAGTLTKTGAGALTFASPQATIPAINFTAGALGFSGTQNFGAATVPAGLAYQFDSDPGSGVSITVGSTSRVIANYASPQSLISRLSGSSTGVFALTSSSAANLDFNGANVSLGATVPLLYTGTITPNATGAAYKLGGGGGRLYVTSTLSGANGLIVSGDVQLSGTNTFTGGITVTSGGRLIYVNDQTLGTASNVVTLDNGILQQANSIDNTGATVFGQFGNQVNGGGRIISVAAGGGTIDVPARQAVGNAVAITTPNGLIGSGALSKTGLGYLFLFNSDSYSGVLTVASNGGIVDLRAGGALPNVTGINVNQGATFQIDNQNGLGARQFPSSTNTNRVNDTAAISLTGGTITLTSRATVTNKETFGAITLGSAMSQISTNANAGTSAAVMAFGNLTRTTGSTVRFGGNAGVFGAGTAGVPGTNNSQVTFANLTTTVGALGWGSMFGTDLMAYDATLGVKIATYTAQAAAAFTPAAANNYNLTAVGTATLNAGNQSLLGLRFGGAANAQVLAFTGATDTLFVTSGGVITDGGAATRAIGATALRGQITAGPASGNTTPQELFLHNNANTLTVFSTIVNNNGQNVAVVKDLDGTVVLDAANTYSGGTYLTRGVLTANNAGSLGAIGAANTGLVLTRNSTLNLGAPGAVSGTPTSFNGPVYTTPDNGEIVLTANTTTAASTYNAATDRFSISNGATIFANSPGANFGLNSLTRVSSPTAFTGGGQIYLEPGAIIRYNLTNAPDQGTGTLAINNLGTNADLFFSPATSGGALQTVTVGTGTPYRGLSTDRSASAWLGGTIYANSDFTLQGLTRDNGLVALTLGSVGNAAPVGGFSIVNNSGGAIRANVIGQLIISEDEPVYMPNNLTYVLTAGSVFQPNTTAALGFGANRASVLVQAGGTLDPGNYTGLGATFNQQFNPDGTANGLQNLPYPLVSPVNGNVTVEAGGRFIINDTSGVGSAPIGSWTLKSASVLEIGSANAFYGRGAQPLGGAVDTTGVIQNGQFVFEPNVVVRISADNTYKISQFIPTTSLIEIASATRTLTSQNNPFIVPVVGTPTIAPENITLNGGGMLTNDESDRQVSEGRGRLILGNGSILAATSQTYLNLQEGIEVSPNSNVIIGDSRFIDGNPKLGGVQFIGPNSNIIPASSNLVLTDGAQLTFGAINVYPDTHALNLPTAVTAFPSPGAIVLQPGNGTSLLLNATNFAEVIGPLTGNGAVLANGAGNALAAGFGATSDFTFNGVFKLNNALNPSLIKIGTTKMILTGANDSNGEYVAWQGTLEISGNGSTKGALRSYKGATISIDNTATALNNRTLTATNGFYVPTGGTYNLIGNATTPVLEQTLNFANSAGAVIGVNQVATTTTFKITPGAATTTFLANNAENFQNAGVALQRSGTWILNAPTVANAPITFAVNGAFTVPGTNVSNGLIQISNPNFGGGAGSYGQLSGGLILYGAGTSVALTRPDFLGDSNGDGVPEGFMTQDGVTGIVGTITSLSSTVTGVTNTAGLAVGMPIIGTGIPANTTISLISGTTVTLSNPATAAGTSFSVVVGGLRLLTNAEYGTSLRDNQNTGINAKLSGTTATTGDTRIQTLTLTPGSVVNINGTLPQNATPSRLYLNDGGVFVQAGGTATINGASTLTSAGAVATRTSLYVNTGASLFLHTIGDLNLNALVFSDNAVVKTGAGALNVGDSSFGAFRGSLQVDAGTVTLGPNNSLSNIRGQVSFTTNASLFLNGGTLDLGGNSQYVLRLDSSSPLAGLGGNLTSVNPATVTASSGVFSGSATQAISLDKVGLSTNLTLTSSNSFTGSTLVRGGTLILRDSGTISASSGIEVQNTALQLDNSYLGNLTNRVDPTVPVTLKGGTLNIVGAAGQLASQTINSLTAAAGVNPITSNAGGSGATELTIGNLVRNNGTGAYVNFNANYGFIGAAGNTTAVRDFITNVNGNALALKNGIIGNWAIVAGSNFATYLPGVGVGAMGNTADGFRAYSSGDITAAVATDNVNDGTAARTLTVFQDHQFTSPDSGCRADHQLQ